MREAEYHIRNIRADLNPTLGEIRFSGPHVELEMGEGEYDSEEDTLTAEATIEIELFSGEAHQEAEDGEFGDPDQGSIELDLGIFIQELSTLVDEDVEIEEEMSKWREGQYEDIHLQIISIIESGFVSEIFSPLDNLLEDSFMGLLPFYRFTKGTEEDEGGGIDENTGQPPDE